MNAKYKTIKELKEAFENGQHPDAEPVAYIDNDNVSMYVWDPAGGHNDQCLIDLDPREALKQAFELLGIIAEDV